MLCIKKLERIIPSSAGSALGLMTLGVCKRIAWPLADGIAFLKCVSLQIISRGISLRCNTQVENGLSSFDQPACVFFSGSLLNIGGFMCLDCLADWFCERLASEGSCLVVIATWLC